MSAKVLSRKQRLLLEEMGFNTYKVERQLKFEEHKVNKKKRNKKRRSRYQ